MSVDLMKSKDLELDMPMDIGIAPFVHILREHGIETSESCEGGEGHPFHEPTIRIWGGHYAGFEAYGVAVKRGLPVSEIRRFWDVIDGELTGPFWEIVFTRKAQPGDY